ncbi:alpha/beta hydrolase fold domain-containing protein [Streptomyces lomondensis]|uniref:Esterase n=1 Tax=Streptomyces lomondensis TaxID=68229 RepID=A0ABQ2XU11_9ACTN|nr:alpha/beta hydrolase fold domain-containing protein [Streptomyces lomondensis]MCF0080879.1 alpha/beta hydrolase [Streptomyces lomondensis]GGX30985.1 esterase [Streptomyces lomondensis]
MPVDPQIAASFALLDGITSYRDAETDPDKRARLVAALTPEPGYDPPPCAVRDVDAPGPHGAVPVRVYAPRNRSRTARPGLVWAHGGGFRFGNLDMPESDMVARELCHRADAIVLSVDYRLAVDGVTYPVPHDDVVAAWRWVAATTTELGLDPGRLALGGASAGGNLAAGAALRLRDEGDLVRPCRLLLAYPVVHRRLPPLPHELRVRMTDIPRLLRFLPEDVEELARTYLGESANHADVVPGYAMPAEADVSGLPPTVIITSEYDDLRASAEVFAEQLARSSVPTRVVMERGVLHGHLNRDPRTTGTNHSLDLLANALTP